MFMHRCFPLTARFGPLSEVMVKMYACCLSHTLATMGEYAVEGCAATHTHTV